ncbi:MAG: hypothetical protein V7629_16105 [Motiliproteus sp.]
MPPKTLIYSGIGLVVVLLVGIAGYFAAVEMEAMHKQNVEDLADFGSKVVPAGIRSENDGSSYGLIDGNLQLAPSIREKKLSPTEKVILSLSRDKDELQIELTETEQTLQQQQERLQELRAYKAENERFAPHQLTLERRAAEELLSKHLDSTPGIDRFSSFQRRATNLATASLYTDIMRQYQLRLNDQSRAELVKILPRFGLCFGDGLPYAINSHAEEAVIIKALSNADPSLLTGGLGADFNSIHSPCLKRFNRDLGQLLSGAETAPSAINGNPLPGDSLASSASSDESEGGAASLTIDLSLSLTEQLIQSLRYDKETVLKQATQARQRLAEQTQELEALKRYHDETERFAPLPSLEERNRAQALLLSYLEQTRDAKRFNSFQKEAMSYAAANHYARFSTRERLLLTEAIKDQIINEIMPNFGFCFGDGLKFAIDNHQQERQVINALREQDTEYMDPPLAKQIATISEPCKTQLQQQLNTFL